MQRKLCGWDERALKTVLDNLKGFVLKSGGDEDATKRPPVDAESRRGTDGTDVSKADQHRQQA